LKAIFHSSIGRMRIGDNTLKIYLKKIVAPDIISSISSNLGMGKRYLIVILLIALLSMYIRYDSSFFSANNAGTAHELMFF